MMSRSCICIPRLVCAGLLLLCSFCGSIFLCGTAASKSIFILCKFSRQFLFFSAIKIPPYLPVTVSLPVPFLVTTRVIILKILYGIEQPFIVYPSLHPPCFLRCCGLFIYHHIRVISHVTQSVDTV